MKKIIYLCILLTIIIAGIYYLEVFYLPHKVKEIILNSITDKFTQGYIEDIKIHFPFKIQIKNLKILRKSDLQKPLLQIDNMTLQIFILPFMRKKFYVHSIKIERPVFYIQRSEKGLWEIEKIYKDKKKQSSVSIFAINKLLITEGRLNISDKKTNFIKQISSIYVKGGLKHSGYILNINIKDKHLPCKGTLKYNLITKNIEADFLVDKINLLNYTSYFPYISSSLVRAPLEMVSVHISKENNSLKLNSQLLSKDIVLKYKNFLLEFQSQIHTYIEFDIKNKLLTQKKLHLKLNQGTFWEIPYIKEPLSKINGDIFLDKERLKIHLQGAVREFPVYIEGCIDDVFDRPYFDVKLVCSQPLKLLKRKQILKLPFKIKGSNFLHTIIKGYVDSIHYINHLELRNASIVIPEVNLSLNEIQGQINITSKGLNFKDVKAKIFRIPIKLEGKLNNFLQPKLKLNISSKNNIKIRTDFEILKDKINNFYCEGEILHSHFKIFQNLKSQKEFTEFEGFAEILLEDLNELFKDNIYLQKIKPKGGIKVLFNIDIPSLFTNSQVYAEIASSESISLYKFRFSSLKSKILYKNNTLVISPLQADVCAGKFELRTKLDITNKNITGNLILEEIDLKKFAKSLSKKPLKYQGKINAQILLQASNFKDIYSYKGEGRAEIKEGLIWELNLFKKLGQFLFVPEFKNIVFAEGYMEFIFEKGKLFIDELELKSSLMKLHGQGKISLDKKVNFIFFPEVNSDFLKKSKDIRKITSLILGKGGFSIEVEGDWDNPEYKIHPTIFTPFRKFKEIFKIR